MEGYSLRAWSADRYLGGAFLITMTYALTAHHCVFPVDGPPVDLTNLVLKGHGFELVAEYIESALDVAVLQVSGAPNQLIYDLPRLWGELRKADEWATPHRPQDFDPVLSGRVAHPALDYSGAEGESQVVAQLSVGQSLQDYHGYSGAPIEIGGNAKWVAAILTEQYMDRLEGKRATDVLFAPRIFGVMRAMNCLRDSLALETGAPTANFRISSNNEPLDTIDRFLRKASVWLADGIITDLDYQAYVARIPDLVRDSLYGSP